MRILQVVLFICLTTPLLSQVEYKETTLEILDKIEREFKTFLGESESVKFSLLRKTVEVKEDISERIYVSVEIKSKEHKQTLTGTAVTMTSNLNFSVSGSSYNKVEHKTGNITLDGKDLKQITSFLNESIKVKAGEHEHSTSWALEINERFSIALLYEEESKEEWKYFMALDDAQFEIPFMEGINLMKKLVEFSKVLNRA